ncbi:NHLP bacteriocin export ABC transporter permease/ATPase subunit [Methylobacterium organophilum]|uniref:NHLP bacteriocin export ABC transporter permease/ATPase subunit n=1 Tax=Methylobacterium organophilum TaxID=410 RepID=UPI001F130695|nr:NHLP bacteriocin export ABC transporter permease/ATPase subunit [Methylobacterium organophilum]UMY16492.1 NHLP bacteriocin export ABC transporter permease/ATPase subunit [Methylobacterium organophilum]
MLHEPAHRIAGQPVAADGRSAVALEGGGLRLEEGSAVLYLDRPGQAGRRRRLLTLEAGDIALPLEGDESGLRLLAFPAEGARLSCVPPEPFLAALEAADPAAIAAMERWLRQIARVLETPPAGQAGLLEEGTGAVEPDRVARPAEGLLWIDVIEGAVATGLPGADPCRPGDPPVPVAAATGGITSEQGATVLGRSSAGLAAEGGLARAFAAHQARLSRAFAACLAEADAAEAAFIAGKARHDQAVLAATIEPLLAESGRDASAGSSLAGAFRAVAVASGVALPSGSPPAPEAEAPPESRIDSLAAWAGTRPRRVRLTDGWWRKGGQAMLGFRAADGAPVALIAGTGWQGGYRVWWNGARRRVDARVAAGLADHGYVLQRRLPDAPIDGRGLLRFASPLALPLLLAVLVIGLASSALSLVMPIATEILFETVIPASSRPELLQLTAGIAALGLGAIVFELVRSFVLLRLATLLNVDLEGAVWDRLLRLPASFFRTYASGDLALRASAINQMRDAISGTVIGTLLSAVFSVSSLALIVYYEWRLALVAIGLVLIELTVMILVNLRVLAWKRQALAAEGRLQALALQLIQGIAKLKVAGAEARGFARWASLFIERRGLDFRQHGVAAGFSAFGTAFGIAGTALMIGIIGLGGVEIGLGRFIAFNAAYGQFMAATLSLGGALPALLSLRPLYERAAPLLQAVPEASGSRGAAPDLRGGIEIRDVVFRYQAEGPLVLDGVSLTVRPGEFVGIVGTSGSGKSTLLRLLLGFESPASGSIFFDDQDMAALDKRSLRRQMGVVLQGSRASGGTLKDAILSGAPLLEADAWEAARMAGLDDDIRAMPMGMHTFVGEDGALLSGGQRQRLLIARAIVRRPRILLFDEATSALDNRTQQIVSDGLERLDVTRIVIAHRLSTIQNADRIYLLDSGRIAEQGRYAELMEKNGLFAELVRRQIT